MIFVCVSRCMACGRVGPHELCERHRGDDWSDVNMAEVNDQPWPGFHLPPETCNSTICRDCPPTAVLPRLLGDGLGGWSLYRVITPRHDYVIAKPSTGGPAIIRRET